MNKPNKTLVKSFRLAPELWERIERQADSEKIGPAEMIRILIERQLDGTVCSAEILVEIKAVRKLLETRP